MKKRNIKRTWKRIYNFWKFDRSFEYSLWII